MTKMSVRINDQPQQIEFDNGSDPLKIRARIIIGRDGDSNHQKALRNFNAHLHRIEIITYDQLIKIAERVLNMFNVKSEEPEEDFDDIPF